MLRNQLRRRIRHKITVYNWQPIVALISSHTVSMRDQLCLQKLAHRYVAQAVSILCRIERQIGTTGHPPCCDHRLAGGVAGDSRFKYLALCNSLSKRSWLLAPLYALSTSYTSVRAPLLTYARICIPTARPPDDCPWIVILSGSPPKASMFLWTHSIARR
jgi:hypothetical protein